jgi:hypothetical protein
VRWFAFGEEAVGVIAIGQVATGVVAIGQIATGVVAVGQLARGVFVVGQLAFGVVSFGQLSLGLAWAGGMVGLGGRAGPNMLIGTLLRPSGAVGPVVPTGLSTPRLTVLLALAVAYWYAVLIPLHQALYGMGGVLNPLR